MTKFRCNFASQKELNDTSLDREFSYFSVEHVSKRYGGIHAIEDVSLSIQQGEIVGLIGPNGAGKTTLFNLITRLEDLDAGQIYFHREYIHECPPHRIVELGIARTFQNIRILPDLSVLDNIRVAYHVHSHYTWFEAALRLPRFSRIERDITRKSMEFLALFDLDPLAHEIAGGLPYGIQRKIEIARALATEAEFLLLDEPAAGLNPRETAEIAARIRQLRDRFHLTIFLIEHDMRMVMSLCERIYVLNFGRLLAVGTPDEIKKNPDVIEAYLGPQQEERV